MGIRPDERPSLTQLQQALTAIQQFADKEDLIQRCGEADDQLDQLDELMSTEALEAQVLDFRQRVREPTATPHDLEVLIIEINEFCQKVNNTSIISQNITKTQEIREVLRQGRAPVSTLEPTEVFDEEQSSSPTL